MASGNFTFINGLTTHGSLTIVVILSISAFIIIAGNILVLGAAATSERLKQQKSTAFIVSLACADLMMGAMIMPFYISITYIGYWLFGRFLCQLYFLCTVLSMNASINTLCVIAIDRYVAITAPLRYESLMTHKRIRSLIVFVWMVSLGISWPNILISKWSSNNEPVSVACFEDPACCVFMMSKVYTIVMSLVVFFLPLTIMLFVYSNVLTVAHKQVRICRFYERNEC